MGCVNDTCIISNLPITDEAKVVAFILGPYKPEITCFGDSYFPLTLPFRGKYDSYGGVDKIKEDFNTELMLKFFNDTYLPANPIFDDSHVNKRGKYVPSGKPIKKVEDLRDLQRCLIVQDNKIKLALVLEDVYINCINIYREFYQKRSKGYIQDIKEQFEHYVSLNEPAETEVGQELKDMWKKISWWDNSFTQFFGKEKLISCKMYLEEYRLTKNKEVVKAAIDHVLFHYALDALRKDWHESKINNQSLDLKAHKAFHENCLDLIQKNVRNDTVWDYN